MELKAQRSVRSWRCPLSAAILALGAAWPAGADPTLTYSTFLGGSQVDVGQAVAAAGGFTYIAGVTRSEDYPVSAVSPDKPNDGSFTLDPFVTVLDSSGSPWFSTFVESGANHHRALGIGAGPDGDVYVTTLSFDGADANTVVTRLAPWGQTVWTRTIYGRVYFEGMAVDAQGNVYLAGRDNSDAPGGGYHDRALVWKIATDGSTAYRTVIDGSFTESGYGIAVDAAGNAYVTGATTSTNLPKSIQAAPPGSENAFLTALGPAGEVLWTTYLGGSGSDAGWEIAVAADRTLVVAGTTRSADLSTSNAIQTGLGGVQDVFLARFRYWGSRISSTYLGGSGADEVHDLALEPGSILLAVDSPGADSPLQQPLGSPCGGGFLAKLDASASQVLDAACLADSDVLAVAAGSAGIFVTGSAGPELSVADAWQPTPAGGGDAFATELTLNHAPDCSAATASPGTLWPANGSFVPAAIRGVTDLEGEPVTVALTSIYQDEWLTFSGTPDATGLGTSTARLRAARLQGGDGRVYHLRFTATDSQGGACAGLVKVCVPPTQGGSCGDGGARVNSTAAW